MRPMDGEVGEGPASVVDAAPPGQMRVVRSSVIAVRAASSPVVHARMNSRSRATASEALTGVVLSVALLIDEAVGGPAGSFGPMDAEKTLGCERKVDVEASLAAVRPEAASVADVPGLAPVPCGSTETVRADTLVLLAEPWREADASTDEVSASSAGALGRAGAVAFISAVECSFAADILEPRPEAPQEPPALPPKPGPGSGVRPAW